MRIKKLLIIKKLIFKKIKEYNFLTSAILIVHFLIKTNPQKIYNIINNIKLIIKK